MLESEPIIKQEDEKSNLGLQHEHIAGATEEEERAFDIKSLLAYCNEKLSRIFFPIINARNRRRNGENLRKLRFRYGTPMQETTGLYNRGVSKALLDPRTKYVSALEAAWGKVPQNEEGQSG